MDEFDTVLADEILGEWRNDEFNSDGSWDYDPFGPDVDVWEMIDENN